MNSNLTEVNLIGHYCTFKAQIEFLHSIYHILGFYFYLFYVVEPLHYKMSLLVYFISDSFVFSQGGLPCTR